MDDEELTDEERSAQVRGALLKGVAVIAVIGVVIALGTMIVVRALDLNQSDSPGPVGSAPAGPAKPLPTRELPVPGKSKDAEPTDEPSDKPTKDAGRKGRIELSISPIRAGPNERVNLTGTYRGADNLGLQVQRFQDGDWHDFGVSATVRVGTYETFVMTGRAGESRFRMYDPQTKQGSNVVLVTID
jgi:hypothetical protein